MSSKLDWNQSVYIAHSKELFKYFAQQIEIILKISLRFVELLFLL